MRIEVPAPQPLVRRFMPELDVLRGIAVLGVLFFHGFRAEYGQLSFTGVRRALIFATQPGALGVNLFFVLSGFLITGILLDSRSRPDYYQRFYTRRALRILPAYYALLILLGILHQASAAFLGLSFVYLSNVVNIFGVSMDYHPLWSLAVEEHYYIVWPSVVRKLRARSLALFSIAICILVPVARGVCFHHGYFQDREWYTWFTADGLAAGSLLALALRSSAVSWLNRRRAALVSVLIMGSATVIVVAGAPLGVMSRQTLLGAGLQLTFVNTFFSGLLLFFLVVGSGSRKGLVHNPALQFFGYISYGLYLVHPMLFRAYDRVIGAFWPQARPSLGHFSLIVLRFAIVGAFSVGLSFMSRRYYEEWFLQLKQRFAPQPDELGVKVVVNAAPSTTVNASESF